MSLSEYEQWLQSMVDDWASFGKHATDPAFKMVCAFTETAYRVALTKFRGARATNVADNKGCKCEFKHLLGQPPLIDRSRCSIHDWLSE